MSNTNTQKRALGKGLSALMGDYQLDKQEKSSSGNEKKTSLPISQLKPSRFQPRRHFESDALNELSESIKQNGLLQPIIVRNISDTEYEIIAGERRWRAAAAAGLTDIPVLIKELSDKEAFAVALLENIQRENLSAIEEAEGYRKLMEEFSYTQEELAKELGKSRSHIANLLRILSLPEEIKTYIDEGKISMGHARALVGHAEPSALAQQIITKQLNVRQAEQLAKAPDKKEKKQTRTDKNKLFVDQNKISSKSDDTLSLEKALSTHLNLQVEIDEPSLVSGDSSRIILHYKTLEQLDYILRRLQH
jgi:ParB family chromosome partitioning protein